LTEAVTHARSTIKDWKQAQDHFNDVVQTKYHYDVYNSPNQRSGAQKRFMFASNTLARVRLGRQETVDLSLLPLQKRFTLKR